MGTVPVPARCAPMTADPSIHIIDTGFQRPGFDAAYLIVENGRGAFVDCGTGLSVPAMLQGLADAGLGVDAVDWLLLTHVHLDHAGGAGLLMQQLPNAKAVLHPRGAPHMIDPARLVAGATAVYGAEEIARSYGRIEAIPEHRVVVAGDGHRIDLAGREHRLPHGRADRALFDSRRLEAVLSGDCRPEFGGGVAVHHDGLGEDKVTRVPGGRPARGAESAPVFHTGCGPRLRKAVDSRPQRLCHKEDDAVVKRCPAPTGFSTCGVDVAATNLWTGGAERCG